jgi:hypothetical protein
MPREEKRYVAQRRRSFASLRMTSEGAQDDKRRGQPERDASLIMTSGVAG